MRYAGLAPRQQLRQIATDLESLSLTPMGVAEIVTALRELAGEPSLAVGHRESCASIRIFNRGECDCLPAAVAAEGS